MADKTAGVKALVEETLFRFAEPYGEDITLDVFKEIEISPTLLRKYRELEAELSHDVVNNWIGVYTKELTMLRTLRQVDTDECELITSYSKLVP
jgi:hypothetical protein